MFRSVAFKHVKLRNACLKEVHTNSHALRMNWYWFVQCFNTQPASQPANQPASQLASQPTSQPASQPASPTQPSQARPASSSDPSSSTNKASQASQTSQTSQSSYGRPNTTKYFLVPQPARNKNFDFHEGFELLRRCFEGPRRSKFNDFLLKAICSQALVNFLIGFYEISKMLLAVCRYYD